MILNRRTIAAILGISSLVTIAWATSASRAPHNAPAEQRALDTHIREAEVSRAARELANPRFAGWRYSTERDAMRGLNTRRADLLADNYNPSLTPTLTIWRRDDGQTGAQLTQAPTDIGYIQCDPMTRTFSAKVDGQSVQQVRCQQTMNVVIETRFVRMLRRARRVTIEVLGSNGGPTQFTFQTAGLDL